MKMLTKIWYTRQLRDLLSKPQDNPERFAKMLHCLNKGADANTLSAKILQQATYANNTALLAAALDKGASQNDNKYEAMNWALFTGQAHHMKMFLDHDKNAFQHIRPATYQQACLMAHAANNADIKTQFKQILHIISDHHTNNNPQSKIIYKFIKELQVIEIEAKNLDSHQVGAIENFILQQRHPQKTVKSCCQKNSI